MIHTPPSSRSGGRWRTACLLLTLMAFPAVMILVVPLVPFFPAPGDPTRRAWWNLVLWLVAWEWALVAFVRVGLGREGLDLTNVGVPEMDGRNWLAAIGTVAAAAAFLLLLPPSAAGREASLWYLPATPWEHIAWLGAAGTAGFCEEVLFRGFALGELRRRWGRGWLGTVAAVAVTTAAFVVIHGLGQPLDDLLRRTAIGLLFAGLALWRGDLRGPIYIHFLTDVAVLYLL